MLVVVWIQILPNIGRVGSMCIATEGSECVLPSINSAIDSTLILRGTLVVRLILAESLQLKKPLSWIEYSPGYYVSDKY